MFSFDHLFTLEFWLLTLPAIILALTVHEFSHGYAAYRLGDRTAKVDGRLSFNPIRHVDPIGLILLIIFRFGFAKPVMVDPYNLRNPKQDMAIIAAAGPLSNLIFGFVAMLIVMPIHILTRGNTNIVTNYIIEFFVILVQINIGLAVFNLIPIPPLDGSKILACFLPTDLYFRFISFRHGIILILLLAWGGAFIGIIPAIIFAIFDTFESAARFIFGFLV